MEFKYGMKEKGNQILQLAHSLWNLKVMVFSLVGEQLYHIVLVILLMMIILMKLLKSLLPLIINLQKYFTNCKALIYI